MSQSCSSDPGRLWEGTAQGCEGGGDHCGPSWRLATAMWNMKTTVMLIAKLIFSLSQLVMHAARSNRSPSQW